jgi:hypothetical protein
MDARFFIAWVVIFVLWMLGGFLVHGALLNGEYAKLPTLFRSPDGQQQFFPFIVIAHALMAGAFVWIYRQGVAAKPFLGQGLRYGIAVALLTAAPTYLIYYAVQPMPRGLVARQIIGDSIVILVLGVVVAWLHRDAGRNA